MRGPYRQLDTRAQKPEPNNAIHEFAKCKPSASRAPHAQIPLANPQHSNTIHELAEDISASPARPRSRPRRDGARTHSKICEPELRVTETAREGRRPPSHSWRDNRDSSLTGFEFSCCSLSTPGGLKAGVPLVLDWEITRKLNRGPIVLQRLVLGNDY